MQEYKSTCIWKTTIQKLFENRLKSMKSWVPKIELTSAKYEDNFLSHNPCFQCNTAITNFLVSNTCEIRLHDVIYRTVYMLTS